MYYFHNTNFNINLGEHLISNYKFNSIIRKKFTHTVKYLKKQYKN